MVLNFSQFTLFFPYYKKNPYICGHYNKYFDKPNYIIS